MYDNINILIDEQISKRFSGKCNRCGQCCEVFESGKPCRHLVYEDIIDENSDKHHVALCNSVTLFAGYYGRPLGCAIYPLQEEGKLPEKCSYEVILG